MVSKLHIPPAWQRTIVVLICLFALGSAAIYFSYKTNTEPIATCSGQQFNVGYASLNEFLDASPSIVFASLDDFDEKNIKGSEVSYPRFRTNDEIKGDYFHKSEVVDVCPVISRDAYKPGQKVLIFFEGKDKSMDLWVPALGPTGISAQNDEGKFRVFNDQTMTLDEIRQAVKAQK